MPCFPLFQDLLIFLRNARDTPAFITDDKSSSIPAAEIHHRGQCVQAVRQQDDRQSRERLLDLPCQPLERFCLAVPRPFFLSHVFLSLRVLPVILYKFASYTYNQLLPEYDLCFQFITMVIDCFFCPFLIMSFQTSLMQLPTSRVCLCPVYNHQPPFPEPRIIKRFAADQPIDLLPLYFLLLFRVQPFKIFIDRNAVQQEFLFFSSHKPVQIFHNLILIELVCHGLHACNTGYPFIKGSHHFPVGIIGIAEVTRVLCVREVQGQVRTVFLSDLITFHRRILFQLSADSVFSSFYNLPLCEKFFIFYHLFPAKGPVLRIFYANYFFLSELFFTSSQRIQHPPPQRNFY